MSRFTFLHMNIQLFMSTIFVERTCISSLYCLWSFMKYWLTNTYIYIWLIYIWLGILYPVPVTYISIFFTNNMLSCLWHIYSKSWNWIIKFVSPPILLFSSVSYWLFQVFCLFTQTLELVYWYLQNSLLGFWLGLHNFTFQVGKNWHLILAILNIPIHEYRIALHLFRSTLIYLIKISWLSVYVSGIHFIRFIFNYLILY